MKIGVDIVKISDFEEKCKESGNTFLNNHFFPEELKNHKLEHLAGIYASKEAIFKTGYLKESVFKKLQVINDESGKPEVFDLNGIKIDNIDVSISHTRETAVAVALWNQSK